MSISEENYVEIISTKYIPDYKLNIQFNDGVSRIIDFEPFLRKSHHPDIKKYLDRNKFQQFTIRYGDLDWNDYELCFPLGDLYQGVII